MVRSCGEVHLCGRRCRCIAIVWANVARAKRPDAVDGQRFATCILEKSVEFSGSQIIGGDKSARLGISATCELPDEQVVAEAPEIEWSQSHAPRGVQPITVLETLQEAARGSINVHKT